MKPLLPMIFIAFAGVSLLVAISYAWSTLRSLFGVDPDHDVTQSEAMRRRSELLDEKDAVLRSLKDLEFERAVGKISEDDWKRLDTEFRVRAKSIIKLLEDDLKEHRVKARALVEKELGQKAARKSA